MLAYTLAGVSVANSKSTPTDTEDGFVWKSAIPDDCPFERSRTLTGIFFTGCHSDYRCGDTFYTPGQVMEICILPGPTGRPKESDVAPEEDKMHIQATP